MDRGGQGDGQDGSSEAGRAEQVKPGRDAAARGRAEPAGSELACELARGEQAAAERGVLRRDAAAPDTAPRGDAQQNEGLGVSEREQEVASGEDRVEGGCLCGAIRVTALGKPVRVGLCHCLDCRKHHGALFFAAAIYPAEAVRIEGEPRDYQRRFFCPACGSSVFSCTGDEVEVHLGALDAPDRFAPDYELWRLRRESWLPPFPFKRSYERDGDDD